MKILPAGFWLGLAQKLNCHLQSSLINTFLSPVLNLHKKQSVKSCSCMTYSDNKNSELLHVPKIRV